MQELSRQSLDRRIDRRTFIRRLLQSGVSLAGATALADQLGAEPQRGAGADAAASIAASPQPQPGRVLEGLTGGELMAEFLLDWDVPYVFGLAGSEETGFLDALVDRTKLQYATCIHESAAMAMADGYSRSTGRTSLVQLHSVAGVAYALGQLAGSYRDRIPVVVTAGVQSTDFRGQNGFLDSPNLSELPRDYTQWVWDVVSAQTIPEVLRRAFLLAEAPPGGPSFVTFSKDLWEQRVERAEILPRSRSRVQSEVAPPPEHVQAIADALLAAQSPALYLGNECIKHEISAEVAEIAELLGAMVMLSVKIPCVFPNTHPSFVGEVGDDPALLGEIDCFWSLGAHMFKTFSRPAEPLVKRGATVIHTSLDDTEVGRNYPVDLAAIASIRTTAALVRDELRRRGPAGSAAEARRRRRAEYSAARRKALDDTAAREAEQTPIATSRLMRELDRAIAPDAEVVSELITSDPYPRRYLAFDHTRPAAARRRQHYTTSGVLGWGVAAAIGTKIGNPTKEVWCLTGDGCLCFGNQALWSAARYEVPVGIVVFNNGEYQANRQNNHGYGRRMAATGKYIGVNLRHPDIDHVAIAKGYGVDGERVNEPGEIAPALTRCKAALSAGRPYLVDVRIARQFAGKDSDYFDFFSVAKQRPRQS